MVIVVVCISVSWWAVDLKSTVQSFASYLSETSSMHGCQLVAVHGDHLTMVMHL